MAERSKLIYRAKEGLMLEGLAYTLGGLDVVPAQSAREGSVVPVNNGMYLVTVTLMVDEVELS